MTRLFKRFWLGRRKSGLFKALDILASSTRIGGLPVHLWLSRFFTVTFGEWENAFYTWIQNVFYIHRHPWNSTYPCALSIIYYVLNYFVVYFIFFLKLILSPLSWFHNPPKGPSCSLKTTVLCHYMAGSESSGTRGLFGLLYFLCAGRSPVLSF